MFSNHFITNFPQNAPVKNWKIGQYLAKNKDMDKSLWLTFLGHPVERQLNFSLRCSAMQRYTTIQQQQQQQQQQRPHRTQDKPQCPSEEKT